MIPQLLFVMTPQVVNFNQTEDDLVDKQFDSFIYLFIGRKMVALWTYNFV